MHISDIIRADSPTFSFEFFPPKTPEAAESLYQTIRDLEAYMPDFVSVTYGAGGSTRDLTHDLVEAAAIHGNLGPRGEPVEEPGLLGDRLIQERADNRQDRRGARHGLQVDHNRRRSAAGMQLR